MFKIVISFWGTPGEKEYEKLEKNSVYYFQNCQTEDYPSDDSKPKYLTFLNKKSSAIKVTNEKILKDFENVSRLKEIYGKLAYFDKFYEFQSCPKLSNLSEKVRCGKKIQPKDEFCQKIGCGWKVDQNACHIDFNVRVIIVDNEQNIHCPLAFKKTLERWMSSAGSNEERLKILEDRPIQGFINAREDDDSGILEEILMLDTEQI